MADSPVPQPEFCRPISVNEITSDGLRLEVEAGPEEKRRLAERFELLTLDELSAALMVTRAASGIPIRVTGRVLGRLTQECVVSLEPVESVIDLIIGVEFAPATEGADAGEQFSVDEDDPPEPLLSDEIDLGELVAQQLAVAINPYPKNEEAEQPDWRNNAENDPDPEHDNPFAVLGSLQKKHE